MRRKSRAAARWPMSTLPTDTIRPCSFPGSYVAGHYDRVGLRGVELDLQDAHDVAERVPGRAVDLRQAAEGQGILQEPGRTRLPQVAARQQQPQLVQCGGQAGERPDLLDDRVQAGYVG